MNAFDALQKYYGFVQKTYGTGGMSNSKSIYNRPTPSHIGVKDTELVYDKSFEKNVEAKEAEEAVETAIDHGFDPDSPEGQKKIQEILEGIAKKNADVQRTQSIQKARPRKEGGTRTGTQMAQGGSRTTPQKERKAGRLWPQVPHSGDVRDALGSEYKPGMSAASPGTDKYAKFSDLWESTDAEGNPKEKKKKKKKESSTSEKALINMEKASVSPHLARLLAAAAGWALSGDIAGKVDPNLAQEWDRASSMHDKRRLQEEMMQQMHRMRKKPQPKLLIIQRKSDDGSFLENVPAFDELHMFYKDHAPIPPRYGLMWDAVKHRWTRPEKVGRTVWEVQGHKRFRGTGTGAHERGRRAGGIGGYGVGSSEAGRRFKSVGDVGRAHPHESKRPGQRALQPFKRVIKPKGG